MSSFGRVFSHVTKGMLCPGGTGRNRKGNVHVTLTRDGVSKSHRVHLLVLEAFVGPRPTPDAVGLHFDDDIWNNRVDNLRWGTRSDNWHDAVRNGIKMARMR